MKKLTLIIAAMFYLANSASAQDLSAFNADTLKSKMNIYNAMLRIADGYQVKAEAVLKDLTFYKNQAKAYRDSSAFLAEKAKIDTRNAELYLLQIDYVTKLAFKFLTNADSLMVVAEAYQDTAVLKNKEAEAYYLKLVDLYSPLIKNDSLNPAVYTVQLGAGNMDVEYFSKAENYEVITPSDGIKRFITGNFKNIDDATAHKQKMVDLGYSDAFVRTMDSLNY